MLISSSAGLTRSMLGQVAAPGKTSISARLRINAFDYLCAVQRHAQEVRREPERWLPWNWPRERADAAAMVEATTSEA